MRCLHTASQGSLEWLRQMRRVHRRSTAGQTRHQLGAHCSSVWCAEVSRSPYVSANRRGRLRCALRPKASPKGCVASRWDRLALPATCSSST